MTGPDLDKAVEAAMDAYFNDPDWRRNLQPFMIKGARDGMRAAIEAALASLSDEWVLVPKEPTKAMKVAGDTNVHGFRMGLGLDFISDVYKAMLSAAPGRQA